MKQTKRPPSCVLPVITLSKALLVAAAVLALGLATLQARGDTRLTTLLSCEDTNGRSPTAALLQSADGSFYGTAQCGGDYSGPYGTGLGTVFRLTSEGVLTRLVSFNGTNGAFPTSPLVQGSDGNLYGMTAEGGAYPGGYGVGLGTVFRLTPDGVLTTLASFAGTNGWFPRGWLTEGPDGNFYGTTMSGGLGFDGSYGGNGTVFRITPGGVLTTLVCFNETNGTAPFAGLVLGKDDSFYGTVVQGGIGNLGGVFKMTTEGALTLLCWFGGTNGACPWYGLVQGADGDFYGVTAGDFSTGMDADGSIFKVTTNGTLTTLVMLNGINGGFPRRLLQGTDGNFYGVTGTGGQYGNGTVFSMTPNGALTTLISFDDANGGDPFGGLIQASDGAFYGTTQSDGAPGRGTIFRLSVPGADSPKIQTATASAGTVTLSWIALVGRTYQLQFKTDPNQTNWQNAGGAFTATNLIATASDSVGADVQRFYRVLMPQ